MRLKRDDDFYSVRASSNRKPVFLPEDLILYEGTASLRAENTVLELSLVLQGQGYGGYNTWLSGELQTFDAFAIRFGGTVPDDFQFGIGYINNPDPLYHNHFHILADLNVPPCAGQEIRVGPPNPRPYASIDPSPEQEFDADKIVAGQEIGFVVDGEQIRFYKTLAGVQSAEVSVTIDNSDHQPLRAYFGCYIEEVVDYSIEVLDPAI